MRTTFIMSAAQAAQLPEVQLPEVAFLGRSNVGKSSLLNALVNARIARTSSTPGRTQHVNLFHVHAGWGDFSLADLPGYGYARAPKDIRLGWGPLVEGYLQTRACLQAAMLLIDARRGVQADDLEVFLRLGPRLEARKGVVQVVVTKIDKLPKSKRVPCLITVGRDLELPRGAVVGSSAKERIGLDALSTRLACWMGGKRDMSPEPDKHPEPQ